MQAAALVAQPAGDADVPVPVQVIEHFLAAAGETVHHGRPGAALEILHHRHEVGVRVALVQEQRLSVFRCQLQLALERLALGRTRRKIAEVVQTAFAHRQHLRVRVQGAHLGVAFVGVFQRVVRVHAGGGEQKARMRLGQGQRLGRMLAAGAGDHHLHDARIARALQHRVAVRVEAVVGEIGADVDELHAAEFRGCAASFGFGPRFRAEAGPLLQPRRRVRPESGQADDGRRRNQSQPDLQSARVPVSLCRWYRRLFPSRSCCRKSAFRSRRIRAWCWKRRPAPARPPRCRWPCSMRPGWADAR